MECIGRRRLKIKDQVEWLNGALTWNGQIISMQISLSTWILIQLSKMNTAEKGAQMATSSPVAPATVSTASAGGAVRGKTRHGTPGKGVLCSPRSIFKPLCNPLLWTRKCSSQPSRQYGRFYTFVFLLSGMYVCV